MMELNYENYRNFFEEMTIPEPNSGCLLWLGSYDVKYGYGRVWNPEKQNHFRASHLSLALAGRPLPHGKIACHTCDNPFCVEEGHLFHGTKRDNTHDMMQKGRQNLTGFALGRVSRKPQELKDKACAMFLAGVPIQEISKEVSTDPGCLRAWFEPLGYVIIPYFNRTHCPKGHEYSPENTYATTRGERICKQCCQERRQRRLARLSAIESVP